MRIICLGDSIMQRNDFSTYPQTGWVQELERFFPRTVEFLNFARNGRSTKSFIEEGRFKRALETARAGDFALIQFGHNDEKANDPARFTSPERGADAHGYTSFRANLALFVTEFQKIGVRPVLLTPVARRKFDGKTLCATHGAYPLAVIETARERSVPCIDATALTEAALSALGEEASRRLFMNFGAGEYESCPDGKSDNSHLRPDGAYFVSKIVAERIARIAEDFPAYAELSGAVLLGKGASCAKDDREIDDEYVVYR